MFGKTLSPHADTVTAAAQDLKNLPPCFLHLPNLGTTTSRKIVPVEPDYCKLKTTNKI